MKEFIKLIEDTFLKEVMLKLIFSRPRDKSNPKKATATLCAHRGRRMLRVEYSLEGNTVSQRNIREDASRDNSNELVKNIVL